MLTLDPAIETRMMQNLQDSDGSGAFVLDPHLAESFLSKLIAQMDSMMRKNITPVMLCRPEIRRALRTFTRRGRAPAVGDFHERGTAFNQPDLVRHDQRRSHRRARPLKTLATAN